MDLNVAYARVQYGDRTLLVLGFHLSTPCSSVPGSFQSLSHRHYSIILRPTGSFSEVQTSLFSLYNLTAAGKKDPSLKLLSGADSVSSNGVHLCSSMDVTLARTSLSPPTERNSGPSQTSWWFHSASSSLSPICCCSTRPRPTEWLICGTFSYWETTSTNCLNICC